MIGGLTMGKLTVARIRLDEYIESLEQTRLTDYWSGRDENTLQLMYLLKNIIDNLEEEEA